MPALSALASAWMGGARADGAASGTGTRVVRTEHLPWLLTDPWQIADYAAASDHVDAVIAVSGEAGAGWRCAARRMPGPRLPVAAVANGIDAAPLPRRVR